MSESLSVIYRDIKFNLIKNYYRYTHNALLIIRVILIKIWNANVLCDNIHFSISDCIRFVIIISSIDL